jgi:hypothetical protein
MAIKSKLVTLSADETTATVADATAMDTVSTLVSMNSAVTGYMGMAQKVGLVAAGAMISNKVHKDSFIDFGTSN